MSKKSHVSIIHGLAWLVVVLALSSQAHSESERVVVGPEQVGLLELYTSEGCSSCPPADRYFTALVDDPAVFDTLVPVAFHVDYWDYLGWRDRFASAAFSARQRNHVRDGHARTVYTPGFFYNGDEWRQFFGGDLTDFPAAMAGGRLTVEHADANVSLRFEPLATVDSPLVATIVRLGFNLKTAVKAGENRGRELRHDFVVTHLDTFPLTQVNGQWSATVTLPEPRYGAGKQAIAVWISQKAGAKPLQAAGMWVSSVE
ncbi:MAG: DUF1223 domain-containing protein [Pseudomonadota bacterium]